MSASYCWSNVRLNLIALLHFKALSRFASVEVQQKQKDYTQPDAPRSHRADTNSAGASAITQAGTELSLSPIICWK